MIGCETMNDEQILKKMRKRIFLMAYAAGIGHIASAYSCLEILYVLYQKGILNVSPEEVMERKRDKFILSKGHGSLALYNVLAMSGFITEEELMTFSMPGTRLGGEPNRLEMPGVEATTGSLGHGLSIGVGRALADKMDGNIAKTYVLIGDGESEEGSIWEAAMSAKKFCLGNLVGILDYNRIQKMGTVTDVMAINTWKDKWQSFGWQVHETDGHNVEKLQKCLRSISDEGKPHMVIANTVKGHGVSIMENDPGWHWRLPSRKELKIVVSELEITQEELDYAKSIHK